MFLISSVSMHRFCLLIFTAFAVFHFTGTVRAENLTEKSPNQSLRISTARSAFDLGLIQALAKKFKQQHPQVNISIHSSGVLKAFSDGREGLADILLTHHKPEEERFVREGYAAAQAQLMYTEYALFGPPNDPLKLHKEKNIITALVRLANEQADFHAPSPQSGTNMKIEELWTMAGLAHEWVGYENTGASGFATLLQAAEFGVYTIAEMATYIVNKERLEGKILPLLRDDLNLRNRYSVTIVNPDKVSNVNYTVALSFYSFLVSQLGQDLIRQFGEQTFNSSVFVPAAHMDPGVREEVTRHELSQRTYYLQIAIIVSAVLAILLITNRILFSRIRLVKRKHIASLAHNEALILARDEIAKINYKLQLEIDEHKITEAQLKNAISQLNQSEHELRSYRDHLESLVRVRTQDLENANTELQSFSYSVSHDLRSPLRAINGFSRILMDECNNILDSQAKDCLNRIVKASNRMDTLIDDILQLSRISQQSLRCGTVDISSLVREILNSIDFASQSAKIHFEIEDNLYTFSDERLLRILLINLLSNAIKYTSKQERPEIQFGKKYHNKNEICFYIRDNGVGFDMQYKNKLFLPFQRLHQDSDFEGNGIGLSTVQRIIHKHGGKIWAESELNIGTTFYFVLPLNSNPVRQTTQSFGNAIVE